MGPRVSQVEAATTTRDCTHGQNDATHPICEKTAGRFESDRRQHAQEK
jgi:hypothetical protein